MNEVDDCPKVQTEVREYGPKSELGMIPEVSEPKFPKEYSVFRSTRDTTWRDRQVSGYFGGSGKFEQWTHTRFLVFPI